MTTLNKLGIQGIRSFSSERIEVIEFEKPVTLIVGHNGAGKTTVIECLKMATTGVLPPNCDKGHGFVFDPNVAGVPEVKGQVKLMFRSAAGKQVVMSRIFQLTNQRNRAGVLKTTFKQLESLIKVKGENGAPTQTITKKCADMDVIIPQLMGVPKAVLESVIFCHQEDSNWPLSDKAALKKKFDDIFGSARYTKALESIEKCRKDLMAETKDKKHLLEMLGKDYEGARSLKAQLENLSQEEGRLCDEVEHMNTEVDHAEAELREAIAEDAKTRDAQVKLAEKKAIMQRLQDDVTSLENSLPHIFDDSLDVLEATLDNELSEQVMAGLRWVVEDSQRDLEQGMEAAKQRQALTGAMRTDAGEAANAHDLLVMRQQELDAKLLQLKDDGLVDGSTTQDSLLSGLQASMVERAAESRKALKAQRAEEDRLEHELVQILSPCQEQRQLLQNLELKKSNLARIRDNASQMASDARETEREIADVERQLSATNDNSTDSNRLDEIEQAIGRLLRERSDNQREVARVLEAVQKLNKDSGVAAEAEVLSCNVESLRSAMLKIIAENSGLDSINPANAEQTLQRSIDAARSRKDSAGVRHRELMSQKAAASARIEIEREHLEDSEKQLSVYQDRCREFGDVREFYKSAQSALEENQMEYHLIEAGSEVYRTIQARSLKRHKCQLCKRNLSSQAVVDDLNATVEKFLERVPDMLATRSRMIEEAKNEVEAAQALLPDWAALEKLQSEAIPGIKERLREAESSLVQIEMDTDRSSGRLSAAEIELASLSSLQSAAARLASTANQLDAAERALEVARSKLQGLSAAGSNLVDERRKVDAAQQRMAQLDKEEKSLRDEKDQLVEGNSRSRVENEKQKRKLASLRDRLSRLREAEEEGARATEEIRKLDEQAGDCRTRLASFNEALDLCRRERGEVRNSARKVVEGTQQRVREVQQQMESSRQLVNSISALKEKARNSSGIQRKFAEAESAERSAIETVETLRTKRDQCEEELREKERCRAEIVQNIKLKSLQRELSTFGKDVEALQKELGVAHHAGKARRVEELRSVVVELREQKSRLEGKVSQLVGQQQAVSRQLDSSLYKNIDDRHRSALIQHVVSDMATHDLSRYHSALDKALMRYHVSKMMEVNRVIRELWQQVYRGQDIDYIAIRSDTEDGAASVTSATRLRSYNYRVVMTCQGVEVDMRGRCSAGQRVLASLIIRLALAESFCCNCGILALDEPTTNLDSTNIEGLSDALADLIEARRESSNFQLLLITHDEEFVRKLVAGPTHPCDYYYRVAKDNDGFSFIRQCPVGELQ
ncbi:DNA repair protein rad50 [Perkinsus olseni]|uniref:DNA repair protein RAD50 n=1 Tax=Perkinsus olseni TaxID=32597 RepID=A0A7J6NDJ8_PEROL|nr:DNA repair protein rad50 [Perkinsus olseni]